MTNHAFVNIHNFRDMGGVRTNDNRMVKHGLLFRSGHLANSTAKERQALQQLGITTIMDYRDAQEASKQPTPKLPGVRMLQVPAISSTSIVKVDEVMRLMQRGEIEEINKRFAVFYEAVPFKNPAYQTVLREVVKCQGGILHHCTAGKDRTGVASALIYLMLGVKEQEIIDEFLLTNDSNRQHPPHWLRAVTNAQTSKQDFEKMADVTAASMQRVFDAILARYATYETFFEKEYGITATQRARLQNYYLISATEQYCV